MFGDGQYPLEILNVDGNLFSSDDEYYPSEWDASEGDKSEFTVAELDLIGYGEPEAFLRRIPEEVKTWRRCKVFLDPSDRYCFYFFISRMSSSPEDIAMKLPWFHYKIPNPQTPGWCPVARRDKG